ncbi:vacuolar protein sorting-associated protein 9A-like isoform X1 [Prosopis cineraria]|uniref:vacuolar protein sorting-associated protein 9A-like isoform X1 n=1 Tax=Prosopis cineraria TaxID=364024 RepID=UPI0024104A85|nr:vacuolar protein sorting-associated protein 9A-like isoform X1 [Prosopis cineraria]
MESADVFLGLHDFLERMRQPSAADFVKAIKSFIVSFSNNAPDPERDSAAVQQFLANMEAAFRAHPLWAGCSEEELESAGEGLEKYVMTKLFTRVFASLPDDVKLDEHLSEKIALIQQFIRPENLDVKSNFQNETSWLLAQKELQKINMYKAPRDKLVCILNCCKVINNLLINASIASNANPPGADEFLPVLIYVTIKANPPQLHSNLLYIQRFRRQSRLVAEAAYFFTNMLSAESFIRNIDAKAVSMDEAEFERNMESARAVLSGLSTDLQDQPRLPFQNSGDHSRTEPFKESASQTKPSESKSENKKVTFEDQLPLTKIPSLSDLENKGASMLLKEDGVNEVFREYPYLFARAGDLTVSDVEDLLNSYKQLVIKYVCLSKGLGVSPTSHPPSDTQNNVQNLVETKIDSSDSGPVDADEKTEKSPDRTEDTSEGVSLSREKNLECDLPPQDEAAAPQAGGSLESSN